MVVKVEFEKGVANACIFCIVISKFSYWQKHSPIILLVVNKCPKISPY